jgi:SsrA-binding protein
MKYLAKNRRAKLDYQIKEEWEAGIVLTGGEVKSAKSGQISLKGAFVRVTPNQEAWLINAHISPYQQKEEVDSRRTRKLLLKKSELRSLMGKSRQGPSTIIPLLVYQKRELVKIKIGLVQRKKKHDRRAELKRRAQEQDILRES